MRFFKKTVALLMAACLCMGIPGVGTLEADAASTSVTKTMVSTNTTTTNGTKSTKTASKAATSTQTTYTDWKSTTTYKVISNTNGRDIAKVQETVTSTRTASSYTKGSKSYKTWTQTKKTVTVYKYDMSIESVAPKINTKIKKLFNSVIYVINVTADTKEAGKCTYKYGSASGVSLTLEISAGALNANSSSMVYYAVGMAINYLAGKYASTTAWSKAFSSEKTALATLAGTTGGSASTTAYFGYAYWLYCTKGSKLKSSCPKTYEGITEAITTAYQTYK